MTKLSFDLFIVIIIIVVEKMFRTVKYNNEKSLMEKYCELLNISMLGIGFFLFDYGAKYIHMYTCSEVSI